MNFKSYKILFALVAIVFSLTSCKKKEDPKPNTIVGSYWKLGDYIDEFNEDGYVYTHEINADGVTYTKDTSKYMTYVIEGDKITTTEDPGANLDPYIHTYTFKLDGDKLELYDIKYKDTQTFIRVPAPTFK